jgi:hypothetical protein
MFEVAENRSRITTNILRFASRLGVLHQIEFKAEKKENLAITGIRNKRIKRQTPNLKHQTIIS